MSILRDLIKVLFGPTPEEKGRDGEATIEYILKKLSWEGIHGKILRNIYIPLGGGNVTEIDLLFITKKGVFAVESKNYEGYIFGNDTYKNWTVTLYGGKDVFGFKQIEKHHFYNPIWQNQGHLRRLQKYLDKKYQFISLIVFSNSCEFKNVKVESEYTEVCHRDELSDKIRKYWKELPDTISEEEIEKIYSDLQPLTVIDEETRLKHIEQVKNAQKRDETKRQSKPINDAEPEGKTLDFKCPWCGGDLVLRTAKHGPTAGSRFYGCSNFPECRYTRNIT